MADSKEWENLVIETGVDSMIDYLAEHGKASTKEISEEIGVSKERCEKWAEALSEENLINKHHTIRSGLVLEYTDENIRETEKKKKQIEEDVSQKSEELQERLEKKGGEVEEKKAFLVDEKENLGEKEKKKAVQKTVERLEVIETRIDRRIKQDNLDNETIDLILEIEEILKQVEKLIRQHLADDQNEKLNQKAGEAVKQVQTVLEYAEDSDEYIEKEKELRRELKAMKKLEKNIQKAKENKNTKNDHNLIGKLQDLLPIEKESDTQKRVEKKHESRGNLIGKLQGLLPISKDSDASSETPKKPENGQEETPAETRQQDNTEQTQTSKKVKKTPIPADQKIRESKVPEQSYNELVNENRITEVMRKISLIRNPDYEALMEAEMANRARPELVNYLEERVEDGR